MRTRLMLTLAAAAGFAATFADAVLAQEPAQPAAPSATAAPAEAPEGESRRERRRREEAAAAAATSSAPAAPAAAAAPATAAAEPSAASARVAAEAAEADAGVVCRSVRVTGTRLPKRVCQTAEAWAATENRTAETAEEFIRRGDEVRTMSGGGGDSFGGGSFGGQ